MEFKIQTDDGQLNLSEQELFTQVLAQVFKEKENPSIANTEGYISSIDGILTTLNENKLDITARQLYSIYFLCGYFYKVFLLKNNVQLTHTDKEQ